MTASGKCSPLPDTQTADQQPWLTGLNLALVIGGGVIGLILILVGLKMNKRSRLLLEDGPKIEGAPLALWLLNWIGPHAHEHLQEITIDEGRISKALTSSFSSARQKAAAIG